jgi:hypothetical protein
VVIPEAKGKPWRKVSVHIDLFPAMECPFRSTEYRTGFLMSGPGLHRPTYLLKDEEKFMYNRQVSMNIYKFIHVL